MTDDEIIDKAFAILAQRITGGDYAHNALDVKRYLCCRLSGLEYEVFGAIFLNIKNKITDCQELFRGSIASCQVHPYEVARAAMKANAYRVILYHNHPAGEAEPSEPDIEITNRVKQSLKLLDIEVIDHIITASGGRHYSFAENGKI